MADVIWTSWLFLVYFHEHRDYLIYNTKAITCFSLFLDSIMKSDFVCSICSKIFKKPISLTCGCTVCGGHLSDKQVQKTNTIKCQKCNINYNVKELESLKPNHALV